MTLRPGIYDDGNSGTLAKAGGIEFILFSRATEWTGLKI
jgi:hypothetical protein